MHDPYLPRVRAIIDMMRHTLHFADMLSPQPKRESADRQPGAVMRGRIIVGQPHLRRQS